MNAPTTTNGHRLESPLFNAAAPAGRGQLAEGLLGRKVARANRWRERYNPLRGLTIERSVRLLQNYFSGEMADLQWAYFFIEQTDPDLFALCERRSSAIIELSWDAKLLAEQKRAPDFDENLAADQAAFLRAAYDKIDNLYEGIEHLASASFRGFAHVEKHTDATGALVHLEPLDQWNVVRDGLWGAWKYNPGANQINFEAIAAENLLDPDRWLVRDTRRHINRIGLIKFVRQNLSQKDWDAFIEIYGIPGTIIIGPPDVRAEKEEEYETTAKAVAEGGSGYLPYGSTVHTSDDPRGANPFREHLRFLQEQLILAGT